MTVQLSPDAAGSNVLDEVILRGREYDAVARRVERAIINSYCTQSSFIKITSMFSPACERDDNPLDGQVLHRK